VLLVDVECIVFIVKLLFINSCKRCLLHAAFGRCLWTSQYSQLCKVFVSIFRTPVMSCPSSHMMSGALLDTLVYLKCDYSVARVAMGPWLNSCSRRHYGPEDINVSLL